MKISFPPEEELARVRKKLSRGEASVTLPAKASDVDKMKFEICKAFIKYKQKFNLNQRELADKLSVDEAIISKILHYKIESFTIDRLLKYLSAIDTRVSIQIRVA
jgi:predicted XRE-type DNA-binding protein